MSLPYDSAGGVQGGWVDAEEHLAEICGANRQCSTNSLLLVDLQPSAQLGCFMC